MDINDLPAEIDRAGERSLEPQDGALPALPQEALHRASDAQSALGEWLGTNSGTLSAIERLKATIDEETADLEDRLPTDFDAYSQRKNRGLLELTRSVRLAQDGSIDPRLVPHLTGLRTSLVKNHAALKIHLDAVREVSAIIARSIQDVESDGTYSLARPNTCK